MDRRYPVVAGAWMTQFVVIGLMFTFGLMFDIFEEEFGWPRNVLSRALAIAFLSMGILAMLAGRLADRFGPRIVLAVAGVLYGVGYTLVAQVEEIWQFYLLFATLIGLGMSTHDVVTLSTIARWFDKRRGLMTAVVKVGTACGQFILPPLLAVMILSVGWREAVTLMGIAAAVVLVLAALLVASPPVAAGAKDAPVEGLTFAEARRGGTLWRLCLIQFMFFPSLMTIPLHIAPHGMDLGLTLLEAGGLLSTMAASSVAGRMLIGPSVDRIGGRLGYILCFTPLIASLITMMFVTNPTHLFIVIALYGFAHGGFFTVVSPTVAKAFGLRAHGAIFGAVLFCGTIGGSFGPILAGEIYVGTGSYNMAFLTLALMGVVGLVLALSLPRDRSN